MQIRQRPSGNLANIRSCFSHVEIRWNDIEEYDAGRKQTWAAVCSILFHSADLAGGCWSSLNKKKRKKPNISDGNQWKATGQTIDIDCRRMDFFFFLIQDPERIREKLLAVLLISAFYKFLQEVDCINSGRESISSGSWTALTTSFDLFSFSASIGLGLFGTRGDMRHGPFCIFPLGFFIEKKMKYLESAKLVVKQVRCHLKLLVQVLGLDISKFKF